MNVPQKYTAISKDWLRAPKEDRTQITTHKQRRCWETIRMILRLIDTNINKSVFTFSNNVSFLCIGLSLMLASDSKVFMFLKIIFGHRKKMYIVMWNSVLNVSIFSEPSKVIWKHFSIKRLKYHSPKLIPSQRFASMCNAFSHVIFSTEKFIQFMFICMTDIYFVVVFFTAATVAVLIFFHIWTT